MLSARNTARAEPAMYQLLKKGEMPGVAPQGHLDLDPLFARVGATKLTCAIELHLRQVC